MNFIENQPSVIESYILYIDRVNKKNKQHDQLYVNAALASQKNTITCTYIHVATGS